MKIISPSASLVKGLAPYELIERIGRTCYKSEDKIEEGSAEKFIAGLMKRQHYAMIEHSNVIISMSGNLYNSIRTAKDETGNYAFDLTYIHCSCVEEEGSYVMSGSFRAWRDLFLNAHEDISYMACVLYYEYPLIFKDVVESIYEEIPSEQEVKSFDHCYVMSEEGLKILYSNHPELLMEHITHTAHFICDRGVTHELVRHRPCAFAQESTRYCNYSKGKFGSEITVILPCFFDTGMGTSSNSLVYEAWKYSGEVAERKYLELLNYGATPQEARSVLPNSLKTEIYVTTTEKEWQHIVDLRYLGTTGAPHPQMKEVMSFIVEDLVNDSDDRINLLDKGAK